MKFKELHIENVQSIEKLTLEFPEENAVYRIDGPNSTGKSAIRRAIEVLLYNDYKRSTKDIMRDGKKQLMVRATGYCGHIVTAYRGTRKGYNMVYPDGTEVDYPMIDDVPDEIAKVLNMYIDPLSEQRCNVRSKDDPLFLISTADKDTYTVIQTAIKSGEIKDAITLGNTVVNEIRRERDGYTDSIASANAMLESLDYIDPNELVQLDTVYNDYNKTYTTLTNVANNKIKQSSIEERLEGLTGRTLDDDILADIDRKFKSLNIVDKLLNTSKAIEKLNNQLVELESIDITDEHIKTTSDNLTTTSTVNNLINKANELNNITSHYNKLQETINIIDQIPDIRGLVSINSVISNSVNMMQARVDRKANRQELANKTQLESDILKEMKICPTCGNNTEGGVCD